MVSNNHVKIPIWIVTLAVTVILAVSGFAWNQARIQSRVLNTLEVHDREVTWLKNSTVGRTEFDRVEKHILRVEAKLDRLIEKRN